VDIPDLTLSLKSGGNYVVPSCTLDFDEPLLPNTSYTLVVDLREVPYARSNIYWDGSKLTFDRTNKGNEDFHGVLFKWGSLVGISPEEGHLVERVQYVPLYIPANISSRTWDDTKTIGTSAFGSWAGIPGGTMSDDFSNHRGDICRYIDDDWRIPLYTWGGLVEQGITFSSVSNPNDATGRGSAGSAGFTDSKYGMFFPASLYRNSDGVLSNPYLYAGYYMGGGSPNNTFYFESSGNAYSGIGIGTNDLSHVGFSVRCIKADF
jgi:hypothetical protein